MKRGTTDGTGTPRRVVVARAAALALALATLGGSAGAHSPSYQGAIVEVTPVTNWGLSPDVLAYNTSSCADRKDGIYNAMINAVGLRNHRVKVEAKGSQFGSQAFQRLVVSVGTAACGSSDMYVSGMRQMGEARDGAPFTFIMPGNASFLYIGNGGLNGNRNQAYKVTVSDR